MVGLGYGVVGDSGLRGLPHSHMRFAPMEMMENRLLGLLAGLRIRGDATELSAAHADMSPMQGCRVARLGKGKLVCSCGYWRGCGFWGFWWYRAVSGTGAVSAILAGLEIAGSDEHLSIGGR